MQAALDHFAANQSRKNSETSEENSQAEIVELDDAGEHLGIFGDFVLRVAGEQRVNEEDDGRAEGEEVNPGGFPGEQIAAHLNAGHAPRLQPIQAPRLLRQEVKEGSELVDHRVVPPSEPIRY